MTPPAATAEHGEDAVAGRPPTRTAHSDPAPADGTGPHAEHTAATARRVGDPQVPSPAQEAFRDTNGDGPHTLPGGDHTGRSRENATRPRLRPRTRNVSARAYQAFRDLARMLSTAPTSGAAPQLLCGTVVDILGLPAARVVVSTADARTVTSKGEAPSSSWHTYVLRHDGTEVGILQVAARDGETELDEQDDELLRMLSDQAAPSIDYLRLYEDLQASRERIVKVREETREQFRRDLHDGLAPALSALRLRVDSLRAGRRPEDPVSEQLVKLSEQLGESVLELRRILDGVAPQVLDRKGLTAALRELAQQLSSRRLTVRTEFSPDPLPGLSVPAEVALYRIAAEALHNVVRHADATRTRLTVRAQGPVVIAEISDNGTGTANGRESGIGLRSIRERAAELRGSITITPNPDGAPGTLVRAVLPVPGSEEPASGTPANDDR